MDAILTGNIWKQVAHLARAAKRRLAAVAYVTTDGHIGFKRNDILICDASDRAIKTGETSAPLLQALARKGVEIRSRPDLHAKAAVFGQHALVGSCNLSIASAEDLTDLALLTDRKQIVAQATAFIHALRESSEEIDDDFLRRILKIKARTVRRRGPKRTGQATRFGNKVWLVSVRQIPDDSFPNEQPFVEKAEKKANALVADKDFNNLMDPVDGKRPIPVCRSSGRYCYPNLGISFWQAYYCLCSLSDRLPSGCGSLDAVLRGRIRGLPEPIVGAIQEGSEETRAIPHFQGQRPGTEPQGSPSDRGSLEMTAPNKEIVSSIFAREP